MDYYRPERTYHDLNEVSYPDHSFAVSGADGVLRAGWQTGEQMWDEDMNNSFEWLAFWSASYVFWRSEPYYPYYSPVLKAFVSEIDHSTKEPWVSDVPTALCYDIPGADADKAYYMFVGSRTIAIADRVFFGRNTGAGDASGIDGLAQWQEYVDQIEISFFVSETRKSRTLAAHTVVEPFRLYTKSYSSRVRGWYTSGIKPLQLLKNGVWVGNAWKSDYSSGVTMFNDTVFNAGDRLELQAPDEGSVRYGVTVSIVGELL